MVRKRKKTANKKKNGKKDVKKLTVQQTIAYKEMGRDGIQCHLVKTLSRQPLAEQGI